MTDTACELVTVDGVAVAEEIFRELVKGEGFTQLLSGPFRGRVSSDVEVDDPATVVR